MSLDGGLIQTMQRLRKAEKVHSIKLIREVIVQMEEAPPQSPTPPPSSARNPTESTDTGMPRDSRKAAPHSPRSPMLRRSRPSSSVGVDKKDSFSREGTTNEAVVDTGGHEEVDRPDEANSHFEEGKESVTDSLAHEEPFDVQSSMRESGQFQNGLNGTLNGTIDLRSSLLNEVCFLYRHYWVNCHNRVIFYAQLMKSQESEDIASFGVRAYEVRNRFFHCVGG